MPVISFRFDELTIRNFWMFVDCGMVLAHEPWSRSTGGGSWRT